MQALELLQFVRSKVGTKLFERLIVLTASAIAAAAAGAVVLLVIIGTINPWTGRCVWRLGRVRQLACFCEVVFYAVPIFWWPSFISLDSRPAHCQLASKPQTL